MRLLFLLAAFLSSALLFVVEPLAARLILPTFGGSPQVWNSSLLFFQIALLGGYWAAHRNTSKLPAQPQRWVHLGVGLLGLLVLPLSNRTAFFSHIRDWATHASTPAVLVLITLAGVVGIPFFALSMNSSTLQRWYANSGAPDADQPYFLYAAGNVGSMLSLLAYPFYIETHLDLHQQGTLWTIGYAALVALLVVCAQVSKRSQRLAASKPVEETAEEVAPSEPITRSMKIQWVALSAIPSSLLMGVTTFLTSNVAPVPLLWVVPLALYLLTFVLVFARRPVTPAAALGRIYPLLLTPLVLTIVLESDKPMIPLAGLHLAVFFVATWMCHSRLALAKPKPEHLTEYFLWVSVGGVVGGCFNALLAPIAFSTLAEYPAALVAAAVLMPRRDGRNTFTQLDWMVPVGIAAASMILVGISRMMGLEATPLRTFLTIGVPAILCFLAVDSPARFGLSLAAGFLVAAGFHVASDGSVVLTARSFFGVHRVLVYDHGNMHKLVHGNTIHGIQDSRHPRTPLTYYHPTGPIGAVMQTLPHHNAALVGLGVGSLAAYGNPGDKFTYFEIDPVVAEIASNPKWFTFLRDCRADLKVVLGDARLTLAESKSQYDLMVLDAFSSDAIPVHLLTKEAIEMYLGHLAKHGVLAFHISNRYLDLQPVLSAAARDENLQAWYFEDGVLPEERAEGKTPSHWVVLARSKDDLKALKRSDWATLDPTERRAWTDDFSNVLSVYSPANAE